MTALARGLYRLRRGAGDRWVLFVLAGLWPMIGMGLVSGPALWRGELLQLSVVTMFGLTLMLATVREVLPERGRSAGAATPLAELELGLCLLTAVFMLVAATGGPRSFLYPLVYALVSFLMVLHRSRWVAAIWLGAALLLEALVVFAAFGERSIATFAYHATFIGFFAAGNILVLSSLARRLRHGHKQKLADALDRVRQEARDYRLIASQLPPESRSRTREDEELRMAVAAVETIHEQLFHNVDLLRTSLNLHTCALLWCEGADGRTLAVREMSTGSDAVGERRRLDGPGMLASVLGDPKPLRLHALGGKRRPPYYAGPEDVTDVCVVPLLDGPNLRGLLCADRIGDHPFSAAEEDVLAKAAAHILRVVEQERAFLAVERGKYEQEKFYRASELLNEALTQREVCDKTLVAVRHIAHYDVAVITTTREHDGRHRVLAVDVGADAPEDWRSAAQGLQDHEFSGEGGLVGMAVKNRHFMPASGDLVDASTVIFDRAHRFKHLESLLVLPLVRGDRVIGSITLASARARQYPAGTREMLRVISHQVGVSLDNAHMYEAMEERATTDGLTGLTNHRAFQERMAQLHALSERVGGKYSVILTDIDHFKSINDTYGHPVGDAVLRRVAAILAGRSRKVDIVARYGGEEFCLVLPDTDAAGAAHFANELREEIAAQVMQSEHGTFHVTISMGVAQYPADGSERATLIERADQALYYCKEHGRNRVHRFG
jgi:two-component system cell cycle response regulator